MNCVNHCQNHQNASENITIHNQREKVPESCRACDISCWVHMNALSTTKFQKKTNAQNQCYVYKKYNFCNENEIPCMAIHKWICFDQNEFQSNLWTNFISTRYCTCLLAVLFCHFIQLYICRYDIDLKKVYPKRCQIHCLNNLSYEIESFCWLIFKIRLCTFITNFKVVVLKMTELWFFIFCLFWIW